MSAVTRKLCRDRHRDSATKGCCPRAWTAVRSASHTERAVTLWIRLSQNSAEDKVFTVTDTDGADATETHRVTEIKALQMT